MVYSTYDWNIISDDFKFNGQIETAYLQQSNIY